MAGMTGIFGWATTLTAITRLATLLVLLALFGVGGACDTVEEPPVPPAQTRTLTGVLRSESASPTGWVVEEAGTQVAQAVDLQLVVEQAQRMSGGTVAIRGDMQQRDVPGGGGTQSVFVARSIEPMKR